MCLKWKSAVKNGWGEPVYKAGDKTVWESDLVMLSFIFGGLRLNSTALYKAPSWVVWGWYRNGDNLSLFLDFLMFLSIDELQRISRFS